MCSKIKGRSTGIKEKQVVLFGINLGILWEYWWNSFIQLMVFQTMGLATVSTKGLGKLLPLSATI